MTHSTLTLHALELDISLGWPDQERQHPQRILVDVVIEFAAFPKACVSDHLKDTICYDTLIATLKKSIKDQSFRLIEHVGHHLYDTLRQSVSSETKLHLNVKKYPAIDGLTGGVSFYVGDKEPA